MRLLADEMEGKVVLPTRAMYIYREKARLAKENIAVAVSKIVRVSSAVSMTDISTALDMIGQGRSTIREYVFPHSTLSQGNPYLLEMDDVRITTLRDAIHVVYPMEADVKEVFTLGSGYGNINGANKVFYLDNNQLEEYVRDGISLSLTREYTLR